MSGSYSQSKDLHIAVDTKSCSVCLIVASGFVLMPLGFRYELHISSFFVLERSFRKAFKESNLKRETKAERNLLSRWGCQGAPQIWDSRHKAEEAARWSRDGDPWGYAAGGKPLLSRIAL